MRRGRALLEAVVLGLLMLGPAWGQGQTVGLVVGDQALTASGLTPGQPVVWFGVEYRVDAEFSGDLTQRYEVGTAAADGTAHLDLPQSPAPRSYWMAVDLATGAYALTAPQSYRITKAPAISALVRAAGAQPDVLADNRQYLMGLLVRPGIGAWSFGAGDGGPLDQDGKSDGHLNIALDRLDPLPGSPAARAAANDLWLIVDPLTMQVTVLKGGVAQ
jgi:hypothetical protein